MNEEKKVDVKSNVEELRKKRAKDLEEGKPIKAETVNGDIVQEEK
jgi:hypothetical protein